MQKRGLRHAFRKRTFAIFVPAILWMGVSTVPVHAAAHTTGTQAGETLVVPASTAYSEPRIDLAEISSAQGVTSWKPGGQIVWYGRVGSGALECGISVVPRDLKPVQFVIHAGRAAQKSSFEPARLNALTIWFPAVRTGSGGPIRISLSAASGGALPNVQSLLLRGPAAADAVFNTLPAQRGAPSVHLTYTVPSGDQVGVFYVEVTPRIGPLWTYFEACGWHRGYFGMQINSPTERRIIFSVWDAGTEAVDRSKVAAENRVQLLAKGAGVFAGSFGNEGTGGHSHLVYHWHFNRTYRFLVVAQPKGSSTTYSGFFYFPERKAWGLIASFKAPRDGAYMHGLYSFIEDFNSDNGQRLRRAEFGRQWIETPDRRWVELTHARFTHTGKDARTDYATGAIKRRFYLQCGGYRTGNAHYGDMVARPASGRLPAIEISSLLAQALPSGK